MNKQLIITYFEEFKHWLNGGELLYLFHERDLKIYLWSTTYENDFDKGPFDIDYDITDNHIKSIVINDEYVELRKALAEGKTVQYYVDGFAGWQDVDSVGNHGISGKNNYRIKPEEPQFKVGDWVRIVNCNLVKNQKEVFCIDFIDDKNNCFGFNSDTEYCNMNYLELWKPKPNEWVILESNINDYAFIAIKYNSVALMSERCQPFIGELPTRLKDM